MRTQAEPPGSFSLSLSILQSHFEALIATNPGDLVHIATQDKTKLFMKTSLALATCNALYFLTLFHDFKCGSQPSNQT